jgi:hypothetical protein
MILQSVEVFLTYEVARIFARRDSLHTIKNAKRSPALSRIPMLWKRLVSSSLSK